ncbi:MAG: EAL domain-containing protein [Candidatus Thiodiazotropha endolucinida]|nr:EAL domain-containing protein [Candidatus Thiodiazotropha taylori]MCG8064973.1 EAL domain-containing protein [Candidatus Thiodiazotropha taylori]MCG8092027.1 EAL domain-containing protein [Candidatus Thiodiazotropha endolucinida]MCW4331064.1 EAL domain-containing protein [Candidatus Thiodiazotropha endolucinida]MCW4346166.1 EAL domain-containing protein [Candidatus Thiodiazotropha endolucinida]
MRKRTQVLSRPKGRSGKGRPQIRGKPKATQSDTGLAERIVTLFKDGILVTDLELNIVEINQAFTRVTGYTRDEALGKTPRILSSGRHGRDFYCQMWNDLNKKGHWQGIIWNRRKNGEIYPECLSIETIADTRGEPTHYLGIFSDISHQEAIKNQVHHMAYYDNLTGLPNRELFSDRLELSISQAIRERLMVALFFLDLDHFKDINDSLGHTIGDQLLSAVARRLTDTLRESDTIARFGGDEFTVILSRISDKRQVENVAKKVIATFKKPFRIDNHDIYISTSTGICLFPEHGDNCENMIRHADTAMYQAKDKGKNCYAFYTSEMGELHNNRVYLRDELRRALSEQAVSLLFQPQIDLLDNHINVIEVMPHWQHHDMGVIPPIKFIPIAEESSLIHELGSWTLDTACNQLAAWRHKFDIDLRIALKIPGILLSTGKFDTQIQRALSLYNLPKSSLELEITGSVLIEKMQEAHKSLSRISQLGVRLTIDDFGAGFTSLNYIKRYSIDKIKINRSYICDIKSSECDRLLVRTIINMGHNLSLRVIAEGIESAEQLECLEKFGCDLAQGSYISHPLNGLELEKLLARQPPGQTPLIRMGSKETDSIYKI